MRGGAVQVQSQNPFSTVGPDVKMIPGFVCLVGWLVGWLVSLRPRQLLGHIADGPQDRPSDNFTCCHT